MARRKRRGRKQPFWRKAARAAVGLLGTGIGVAIGTSPFHRGIRTMLSGNVEQGVADIQFDTGVPGPGNPTPDVGKIIGVAVAAGVGIGVITLFRMLARRV